MLRLPFVSPPHRHNIPYSITYRTPLSSRRDSARLQSIFDRPTLITHSWTESHSPITIKRTLPQCRTTDIRVSASSVFWWTTFTHHRLLQFRSQTSTSGTILHSSLEGPSKESTIFSNSISIGDRKIMRDQNTRLEDYRIPLRLVCGVTMDEKRRPSSCTSSISRKDWTSRRHSREKTVWRWVVYLLRCQCEMSECKCSFARWSESSSTLTITAGHWLQWQRASMRSSMQVWQCEKYTISPLISGNETEIKEMRPRSLLPSVTDAFYR